jgi:hypothetical protein
MRLGMISPSGKEACNICSQEHNSNLGMNVEHVEFYLAMKKVRHY